jgi:malonyl-CoA decarboxylase
VLKREFPQLRKFATLSPVPGFRRWLEANRARIATGEEGLERLALLSRLADPAWHLGEIPPALEQLLVRLCAYYLVHVKEGEDRGQTGKGQGKGQGQEQGQAPGAEPLDPVARFHLGNGAMLERINWMGDTSEQGMARSAGLMVNYTYWLAEVERNHERYFREHLVITSPQVEKLARECPPPLRPE